MSEQAQLSSFEELQAENAHHRALILRILKDFPALKRVSSSDISRLSVYWYL